MLNLVSRLVYVRVEFVRQVCETLTALNCSKMFSTLLTNPQVSSSIKTHCVAILNRVLSTSDASPSDCVCVIKDVFEAQSRTIFDLLSSNCYSLVNKVLFLLGLWSRIDPKFCVSFKAQSQTLNNLVCQFESSEQKDLKQGILFFRKWVIFAWDYQNKYLNNISWLLHDNYI